VDLCESSNENLVYIKCLNFCQLGDYELAKESAVDFVNIRHNAGSSVFDKLSLY
jgi:hypothetical protein